MILPFVFPITVPVSTLQLLNLIHANALSDAYQRQQNKGHLFLNKHVKCHDRQKAEIRRHSSVVCRLHTTQ